jgi:hypothetical protein
VVHGAEGDAPAQAVEISDSGNRDRFVRLPEEGPSVEAFEPLLAGEFHAPDIDGTARFSRDGDKLELTIQGPYGRSVWKLKPLSEDVIGFAYKDRIPWRGVLNLTREGGAVTGFALTSRRTRNLAFHRTA